jgi:hypothetical protein
MLQAGVRVVTKSCKETVMEQKNDKSLRLNPLSEWRSEGCSEGNVEGFRL